MKKWFFTKNGEVTGPLNLTSAKEYLVNNYDAYGWHPSFTQWKPVSCISEFMDIVPPPESQPAISQVISEKFHVKKQRLEATLASITDAVTENHESLSKFETQIEDYKSLTQNLNDDVKNAINNIEKKYHTIKHKLGQVREVIATSEEEMVAATENFETAANSNTVVMPSCAQESGVTMSTVSETEQSHDNLLANEVTNEELDDEDLAANDEIDKQPEETYYKIYRGARIAV